MSIPTSLSELPSPPDLFSVQCKVFSYPKNRIWHTTILSSTELLIDTTRITSKTYTTLSPWICPPKLFVIINGFSGKISIKIQWYTYTGKQSYKEILLCTNTFQCDVYSSQSNVKSNISYNLFSSKGSVLCLNADCVRVPPVAEVTDEYNRSNKQSYSDTQRSK